MRTMASILVLILVLTLPGSYFYFFSWHQESIKQEIKAKLKRNIPEEELIIISSDEMQNDPKLRWFHSNEFLLHGRMYDVVRKEIRNGSTFFHCISDDQETRLLNRLDILVRNTMNSKENKQREEQLQTHVLSLFLPVYFKTHIHTVALEIESPLFFLKLASRTPEPKSPPPKA